MLKAGCGSLDTQIGRLGRGHQLGACSPGLWDPLPAAAEVRDCLATASFE